MKQKSKEAVALKKIIKGGIVINNFKKKIAALAVVENIRYKLENSKY